MQNTTEMIKIVSGYSRVLEIGCGRGAMLKKAIAAHKERFNYDTKMCYLGLDAWPKAIEEAKKGGYPQNFKVMDVRKILEEFGENSFSCVYGMDIIEHLSLQNAYQLLDDCDKLASECQAFFVPVGIHEQTRDSKGMGGNHHFDTHRSTWYPEMMVKRGFEVWHYADWYSWPAGAPKDPRAMWCLKTPDTTAQIHECKRRA